ncbi:N-acetylmuramic acid 6-phosphate etherase [Virgibacillus halodenitrificans]|uniref:N-acetylmuramic acid 6-phosphate etherase n=1 Tax=Virgibacillus halodenitrificans TaxID=1482 RepID=A0AAC9J1H6_VIRHA|nr:N-acetylmuramic acid 6-phosphate etherase [Virgibacillus halodenitrificans]APC49200.1 N-acetylmuramic acid 6-phosphate etherase [Virgibacillus halodenitrificans]MCG1026779.1 N-acetylmuramic acid 6-phosphate etherase [Virgibacillus halodenitrificans]MCJ0932902.1 N-acetylmuramic acid 6-phosphate etherase [Virgibacillus halodenitrificans]MEC2160598.1 N-acetylmuramic acid 6-phosphate etherase [Virgibacillus halodenitrificans]MYL45825.1 N-acetylmuramic acid 6-phosphate etherase [Virgibacillus ha
MELAGLTTEKRNTKSLQLDQMSSLEILKLMNEEDKKVALAIEAILPQVDLAVNKVFHSLSLGGRLFYVGAGTSGRLGVMDASECPPTFMTSPDLIQAVMAGGEQAFFKAIEGSEDEEDQAILDLKAKSFTKKDVVIGITASGRTPYPIGAVKYAKELGAYTISLSSNKESVISKYADCNIEVIVGPEVLTGSTRLKAASAHKMILNMISTATMVKLGKVYENLMVDVHASNYKLRERAKRNIMEITNVTYEEAGEVLQQTNYEVKPAIVMIKGDVSLSVARKAIVENNGYVRNAIKSLSS